MGTTRDDCRYIKALITPYQGTISFAGIGLRYIISISQLLDSGGSTQGLPQDNREFTTMTQPISNSMCSHYALLSET